MSLQSILAEQFDLAYADHSADPDCDETYSVNELYIQPQHHFHISIPSAAPKLISDQTALRYQTKHSERELRASVGAYNECSHPPDLLGIVHGLRCPPAPCCGRNDIVRHAVGDDLGS
jgi:hypothetical protein